MPDLVETLKRFNRKERNWLVRDALGSSAETLSTSFRDRLNKCIQTVDPSAAVPQDAWWATDYHIDWLIGGLTMLAKGETVVGNALANTNAIVSGSQQDIDLLVAWGSTLILVEAKGVGSWKGTGTTNKLGRLRKLPDALFAGITPYLVLCSPDQGAMPTEGWPDWLGNYGKPLHITLKPPASPEPLLRVERCGVENRRPKSDGGYWRIVKAKKAELE